MSFAVFIQCAKGTYLQARVEAVLLPAVSIWCLEKNAEPRTCHLLVQVMIEAASSEEQKTPEYRTRKLESLTRQNELIEEENRKREEAKQAQVGHRMSEIMANLQKVDCAGGGHLRRHFPVPFSPTNPVLQIKTEDRSCV